VLFVCFLRPACTRYMSLSHWVHFLSQN
jgi:hypothetical protein